MHPRLQVARSGVCTAPDDADKGRVIVLAQRFRRVVIVISLAAAVTAATAAGASAATGGTVGNFSFGELQSSLVGVSGCGTNQDGEPAIHASRANNVFLGSERGVGSGSDVWR